jgi:predicted NodU family carbamoyl transferase
MLVTCNVRPEHRAGLPAITHEDGTARLQTVRRSENPRYHGVIERFGELTGTPVLINTSFNVRGEPIVRTPEEAYRCFALTDIDALVIGDCVVERPW